MKIYVSIDENGRALGWGTTRGKETDIEIDVPEDSELLKNPLVFVYRDGEFVKDTDYQQRLIDEKNAIRNAPTHEQILSDLVYQLMMKGVI